MQPDSFNVKVRLIEVEDLKLDNMEENLVFKLYFLMCSRLEILRNGSIKDSLEKWIKENPSIWRSTFMEALITVKAFKESDDENSDLAKNAIMTSIHIHPLKKALFYVFQKLTLDDIKNMYKKKKPSSYFIDYNSSIIKLLEETNIKYGSWIKKDSRPNNPEECNVKNLCDMLKNVSESLHNMLIGVRDRINFTLRENTNTNGTITFDEILRRKEYPIYNMERTGTVLIINNNEFEGKSHDPRKGSEKDVEAIKNVWEKFGFDVNISEDVKGDDILKKITEHATKSSWIDSCFVVFIMTHGRGDAVLGSDLKEVKVVELKTAICCSSLKGVGKFLSIQACRNLEKETSKIEIVVNDAPLFSMSNNCKTADKSQVSNYSDLHVMYATQDDKPAQRNTDHGSWFITAMVENMNVFVKRGGNMEMYDLYININERLDDLSETYDRSQLAELSMATSKKLILPVRSQI